MNDQPEQVVRSFFQYVRSGRDPELAHSLMAPIVLAHQLTAEEPTRVERTPQNYADHIREMQAAFGDFKLIVTEAMVDGDRVYVRWEQYGTHIGVFEGFAPTGLPVVEFASAVYRVHGGKIVEYWIQVDRAGMRAQLERNAQRARPQIKSPDDPI